MILRDCEGSTFDADQQSGEGTTQIDHILVSPGGVFLIETKDMNGWVFGSPGQKQWTQSFAAGRRSRKSGINSKQLTFYNPPLQNEGHAKALVNLGIVGRWWLRPIVVFVGDAELKTADKFLPFDEHEKIASQNRAWRMRGVICMSLADLHRYIAFSVDAPSNPGSYASEHGDGLHQDKGGCNPRDCGFSLEACRVRPVCKRAGTTLNPKCHPADSLAASTKGYKPQTNPQSVGRVK